MQDWIIYTCIAVAWGASLLIVARNKGAMIGQLFQNNEDLDSTLQIILKGVIVLASLIIVAMFFISFHDDLSQEHVGMLAMHVVSMASLAISNVTGNNTQKNNSDKK